MRPGRGYWRSRPSCTDGWTERTTTTRTTGSHRDLWRAGCGGSRTSGSGSGPGKRTGANAGTAPRLDFTNRLLRLPGASVVDVGFGAEGVIVTVRLRRRRRVCAECGQTGRQLEVHDRRVKRWRHLDLGCTRCIIECELRRLRCRDCGVRLEPVPWARPGAHHTRDFEDV